MRLPLLILACAAGISLAQEEASPSTPGTGASEQELPFLGTGEQLNWITTGTGQLGEWATIDIPKGMGFLNGSDADKLMKLFGNLGGEYAGALATEDLEWTVIFQFAEEGYVKDDEKDELNAKKLMKGLKKGQEEANKQRKQMGLETLTMIGWAEEPKYNPTTNNLEWGTIIAGEAGYKTVNYETRLLGRHGFMNVTLLCDPEALDSIMPTYQSLLTTFAYVPGKTYAEFRDGDKVAKYGLTALIAGGAAYAAVKTGLLATILAFAKKLWYVVVAAIAAVWGGIRRMFRRATGHEG